MRVTLWMDVVTSFCDHCKKIPQKLHLLPLDDGFMSEFKSQSDSAEGICLMFENILY